MQQVTEDADGNDDGVGLFIQFAGATEAEDVVVYLRCQQRLLLMHMVNEFVDLHLDGHFDRHNGGAALARQDSDDYGDGTGGDYDDYDDYDDYNDGDGDDDDQ